MKRGVAGVIILLLGLACWNVGTAEQYGKNSAKIKESVKMEDNKSASVSSGNQKPGAWRNFKKPGDAILKKMLTPLQYKVTQQEGTEPAFQNEYNANKREGIYVDIVSGEPLFSSKDKYESGTGWPSFTKPLEPDNIVTREDRGFFQTRTEVRSKHGDSHLGHVFPDGPKPTGLRYCMNSAAMRFIPKEDLEKEGYGEYRELEKATFAGGCFWCMESPFDKLPGVVSVTVGYTGGHLKNPTYDQVSDGGTGHAESVQIVYDPQKIGYEKLLDVFWHNIDPTTIDRQFCDRGHQYRSAIFYHTEQQRLLAERSKATLGKNKPFKEAIVTEIVPAGVFYPAEEYHQHYYKKNPLRYKFYRTGCGRDERLRELWGKAAGH